LEATAVEAQPNAEVSPVTFLSKVILELAHGPKPFWDRDDAERAIDELLRLIVMGERPSSLTHGRPASRS
jgi:hypothetical protein